jgi:Ca-activated chloride channel family protein
MKVLMLFCCFCISLTAAAQEDNSYVKKGNEAYRNSNYKLAAEQYQKALALKPDNTAAKFNLGNALQKQKDEAAIQQYDDILSTRNIAPGLKAKTLYNKGVALLKKDDAAAAIEAFKQALSLAPADNEIRENLQKALNEQKQQQQQQQQKKQQDNKDKKKDPNKDQKNARQPNKQMMEQKFNELRNQEKQLQKQLQKKSLEGQPEKDW